MLDLILTPIAAGLVILSIHAFLGLHVIARGVIFVDLAFAQIAALGATVGLLMGVEPETPLSLGFALGFTLLGAVLFSFSKLKNTVVPQEALIGITYVVASAAVLLAASFTAEGAEHVSETLTGTLIWVTWPDILRMLAVYMVLAVFFWVVRRKLFHVSTHTHVEEPGDRLWDFLFYLTFGIAISLSVPIAGVLTVFSALVIPAVIAFLFTSSTKKALIIAWVAGSIAMVGSVATSFALDLATGPLLVVGFGVVLVLALVVRAVMKPEPGTELRP